MAMKGAWLYDQGMECGEVANTAKYLAAEASYFAADQAVQTHGGLGYATEYHVERYWREARLQRLAPVSQEMTLNYIAHNVLRPAPQLLTASAAVSTNSSRRSEPNRQPRVCGRSCVRPRTHERDPGGMPVTQAQNNPNQRARRNPANWLAIGTCAWFEVEPKQLRIVTNSVPHPSAALPAKSVGRCRWISSRSHVADRSGEPAMSTPFADATGHHREARVCSLIGVRTSTEHRSRLPVLRYFRDISGAVFCSAESSDSENGSKAFVDVVDQDVGQPPGLFAE